MILVTVFRELVVSYYDFMLLWLGVAGQWLFYQVAMVKVGISNLYYCSQGLVVSYLYIFLNDFFAERWAIPKYEKFLIIKKKSKVK